MSLKAILKGREVVQCADTIEWARQFESLDRQVAKSTVTPSPVEVSTVFLGLDHSFSGHKPMWFETLVFGGEHDQFMERYTTYDEAEAGHKRICEAIASGTQP